MAMIHGLDEVKVSTALDYASGTADRTGTALDMSGWQGCLVIFKFATIAAGGTNSIKVQSDSTSAFGSPLDIAGTAQTVAADDDNQIFIVDVRNVPERYIRAYVDKDTTNACAETVIYVQYGPDSRPVTNDVTDAVTTETHIWAATGTA